MDGWAGKILRVDLTQGNYRVEALDPILARDFIGGRGLGTKVLFDEVDPNVDPFDPGNKLIFATGPLTGTGAVTGNRCNVVTKSPLTGTITCSNSGGHFASELKFAGYDMIIFEGKSPDPIYLSIRDDDIQIIPAHHLWGKTTHECEDMIRAELEDSWTARETRIANIGPAGEKLVRNASVMNEKNRAAARGGVGAIMGSKNLKAIAVRGTKGITIADSKGFQKAISAVFEKVKAEDLTASRTPRYGTAIGTPLWNTNGVLPVRNFQTGVFPTEGIDKIKGRFFRANILVRSKGCFSCPITCGRLTEVTDPNFAGKGEGPELQSICALGISCGIDNLFAIAKAGYICNELGVDTIGAGNTIACAMELYEKGFLPKEDAGFELNFGNAEAMVELVSRMGLRQDFGDILAEGGYFLAERYGHPELFMGVKKMGMPAFNVRAIQGMGLNLATCNRGADHMKGAMQNPELIGYPEKIDPLEIEGKSSWVKNLQDVGAIFDSAGLCLFLVWARVWTEDALALLEAATGAGYDMESMLLAGERIWNLERLFNLRAGFTEKEDTLPKRMLEEPMPEGPGKGQVCKLDQMLPEYYQLRGWDQRGVPIQEKLAQLGLK